MRNFSKYKNRLLDYLHLKGYEPQPRLSPHQNRERMSCFSPNHKDDNPSCYVSKNSFHCYSANCGINGDIYDAIGILEGITDRQAQYDFAENFFKEADDAKTN